MEILLVAEVSASDKHRVTKQKKKIKTTISRRYTSIYPPRGNYYQGRGSEAHLGDFLVWERGGGVEEEWI